MIERSPYPVILCGDFNEVPYGYAYGRVRKQLRNAFENSGTGFGFTYNKAPRYIRIDNQFYSNKKVSHIIENWEYDKIRGLCDGNLFGVDQGLCGRAVID